MTSKKPLTLIFMILFLAGCGGGGGDESTAVVPEPVPVTNPPVTPPPVTNPTETPDPVVVSPTVTSQYYRLRIEIISSSDWATLTPQNPDMILSVRQIALNGPVSRSGVLAERLWVTSTAGLASVDTPQTLIADVAVSKAAAASGLTYRLEKGVVNDTRVRISAYSDATHYSVISDILHSGVVVGQTDKNPLAIVVDAATLSATPLLSVEAPIIKKKALAFYYPWYVPADWDTADFIDAPLERYSTYNLADVGKVVDKAMGAGLTGFISSWWGPTDTSNSRLQTLLTAIENRNFETSIYYETLRGGLPLDNATIISELTYALNTYGSNSKFMHWNGKPVIFVWATGRVSTANWKTILAAVRANAGPAYFIGMGCDSADMDVFDGMHDYTVNQAADLHAYEKRCGKKTSNHFLLSEKKERKIWVATAMPGYDDTAIANRTEHLIVPRENGSFYRATLEAALASKPDWVVVSTWNEFPENTHIEASVTHGTLYEDITRAYLPSWLAL